MATKTAKKNTFKKGANNIKEQAKKLHDTALETSHDLVEGSLETGEQWQRVMAKALKNSTILLGKQQDMVLDTLESIKGHYQTGGSRLRKLFAINPMGLKKAANKAKAKVETTKKKAAAKVVQATDVAKQAVAKVEKTKPVAKKATKKVSAAKKIVATKKKAATAKTDIARNDLKIIEGIGPKIEQLLNQAGINDFQQLATAKVASIQEILNAAGPRYKMHKPATWSQQAKLAATGKWEELKTLKRELKGGKVVKK